MFLQILDCLLKVSNWLSFFILYDHLPNFMLPKFKNQTDASFQLEMETFQKILGSTK